jgi:hypothetical protein
MTRAKAVTALASKFSDFFGASQKNAGDRAEACRPQEDQTMLNMMRKADEAKPDAALFSTMSTKDTRRDAAWLAARLARSKQFRAGELETETVTITPALAEMMLERNTGNRPFRLGRMRKHMATIKEGRWKLTSQGISFARDGKLTDGQHRLNAIKESGVSVPCRVTFGEDPEVFDVLDTGAPRGAADVLAIAGYKYWTHLAAAARVFAIITGPTPSANTSFPNDKLLELVEKHPLLAEVCTDGHRIAGKLRTSSAPLIAALFLIRQSEGDTARFKDFVERLADGANLHQRHPVLVLRNMLLKQGFEGPNNSGKTARIAAAVILCWNAFAAGKNGTEHKLRWSGIYDFPMPE